MRISDWSSDVCSSDLGWTYSATPPKRNCGSPNIYPSPARIWSISTSKPPPAKLSTVAVWYSATTNTASPIGARTRSPNPSPLSSAEAPDPDRKSVVSGKSVSVSVDLGGRRNIKNKQQVPHKYHNKPRNERP